MSDKRDDLKATNESIREDADRVKAMEERKAQLAPTDPEVDELSLRIEEVVDRMSAKAAAERELAEEIKEDDAKAD